MSSTENTYQRRGKHLSEDQSEAILQDISKSQVAIHYNHPPQQKSKPTPPTRSHKHAGSGQAELLETPSASRRNGNNEQRPQWRQNPKFPINTPKIEYLWHITKGKVEQVRELPLLGPMIELLADIFSYDPATFANPASNKDAKLLDRHGIITPLIKLPFQLLYSFSYYAEGPFKGSMFDSKEITRKKPLKSFFKIIWNILPAIANITYKVVATTLIKSILLVNRTLLVLHNLTNLGIDVADKYGNRFVIDNRLAMPLGYLESKWTRPDIILFNIITFAINTALIMPINVLGYCVNILPIVPKSRAIHSKTSHERQNKEGKYDFRTSALPQGNGSSYPIKAPQSIIAKWLPRFMKPSKAVNLTTIKMIKNVLPMSGQSNFSAASANILQATILNVSRIAVAYFAPLTLAYRILAFQPEWQDLSDNIKNGTVKMTVNAIAPLTGLPLLYSLAVRTGRIFTNIPERMNNANLGNSSTFSKALNSFGKFVHVLQHASNNLLSLTLPLYSHSGSIPKYSENFAERKIFWHQKNERMHTERFSNSFQASQELLYHDDDTYPTPTIS